MNMMVIKYNQLEKQDVDIVDPNMIPICFFLSNHIGTTYGNYAINTKYSYAHALVFILSHFESKSINIVERIETGRFLSREEFQDLVEACSLKKRAECISIAKQTLLSDKSLDNLIYISQLSEAHVAATTAKLRLKRFKKYIEYLFNTFHYLNEVPLRVQTDYQQLLDNLSTAIESIKDENTDVRDPFESVIPNTVFLDLLEVINPFSDRNPWKGPKLRNYLIVTLFIETGIRRGAVGKLKISDIKFDWENPRVMVTRTPNDMTDTRKNKAAQKTKPHASAITEKTLKQLKLYIETDRKHVSSGLEHDFVFVSQKGKTRGQPLSLQSIDEVFSQLSKELGFHIHPHLLRHKWNEIFDEAATKLGYTPEQIEDIRKYAMGWSENSRMSSLYNQFRHAIKTQELSFARQKDFTGVDHD